MFWNQGERERERERERVGFIGMFLNEGEKENKRRGGGIEIGHCTRVWRRKIRKKKRIETYK